MICDSELSFVSGNYGPCELVPRGYLRISFIQPLREPQRSKGISRSKTLVVIVVSPRVFRVFRD
jgi:hypothetical protein